MEKKKTESKPHELYMENMRLREEHDHEKGSVDNKKKASCWKTFQYKVCRPYATVCVCIFIIIVLATILMTMAILPNISKMKFLPMQNDIKIRSDPFTIGKVERKDVELCQLNQMKRSFPDFDYATYGYNIMYGYPLAIGHDPGLTRPIFEADYTESKQTADCRYQVPRGYHLAPDVACVTSFSSEVAKDSKQFSKQLSVSASLSGGGWGASFSASAEYKKKTSQMSASESVFIFSRAVCNYYFSKLNMRSPPRLTKDFIDYVKTIQSEEDVFDLFDYYGTHFQRYTLFGARFIYEYKMSQKSFQQQSSEEMSVSVQASYSGMFSLGGGFGMSSASASAASNFQQKVETKTISIGAPPPANGDTMTWASTVKETPIPVQYELESFENLFTTRFMENTGVDYARVGKLVQKARTNYCKTLKKRGKVDDCTQKNNDLQIDKYFISGGTYFSYNNEQCKQKCSEDNLCFGYHHYDSTSCFVYRKSSYNGVAMETSKSSNKNSKVVLLPDMFKLLNISLKLSNTAVKDDIPKRSSNETKTVEDCKKSCFTDPICALFTFKIDASRGENNCWLFSIEKVYCESDSNENGCKTLNRKQNYITYFIPRV